MDETVDARRKLWGSAATVWSATAVAAVLVFVAADGARGHAWLAVVLGGAVLLSFGIQLAMPGPGLVNRMLAGVGGAVVVLAIASGIGDLLHAI